MSFPAIYGIYRQNQFINCSPIPLINLYVYPKLTENHIDVKQSL